METHALLPWYVTISLMKFNQPTLRAAIGSVAGGKPGRCSTFWKREICLRQNWSERMAEDSRMEWEK